MNEPENPNKDTDNSEQKPLDTGEGDAVRPAAYSRPRGRIGVFIGIMGFICLCTIVLAPIGIVLSLIGYFSVRHSGTPSRLVPIGLIGNSVVVFIASVVMLYLIFFSPELTDGLIRRLAVGESIKQQMPKPPSEQTITGQQAAEEVAKRATAYKDINGVYPLMLTDFERTAKTSLKSLPDIIITSQPLTHENGYTTRMHDGQEKTVSRLEVYACGVTEGNKVGYWDTEAVDTAFAYTGNVGPNSTCAIMK
jgi:hypothetical protein